MYRYKLLLVLTDLVEVAPLFEAKKGYRLEYSLFGEEYKLKLSQVSKSMKARIPIIPINKMKMFYFFTERKDDIIRHLGMEPAIRITLWKD